MAEVELTQGYIAIVDDEDEDLARAFGPWRASVRRRRDGIVKGVYALSHRPKPYGSLLHRLITNAPAGVFVDHKNKNPLDNRKENLRLATCSQNNANSRAPVTNTSGLKGAYWHAGARKWMASIGVGKKAIYLGLHPTKEEAHAAYMEAAVRFFGPFASP